MATSKTTIIEIAAKKLCLKGKYLQSPVLNYGKMDFLAWLQKNIKPADLIQASFKQACLTNGITEDVYNEYFSEKNAAVLNYILQEPILTEIIDTFTAAQSPEDTAAYKTLKEAFKFESTKANETISIIQCIFVQTPELKENLKEYDISLKIIENDFLKIRNILCYAVAQKEIDHLQRNLRGLILEDLKCGLRIIIHTIELIHYNLSLSLSNKDICFTTQSGSIQKNTLPKTLHWYYSTLKLLLDFAEGCQKPDGYKDIFITKIAPFFEILQKERNRSGENLNDHYKWQLMGLYFLSCLPKQIHQVKKVAVEQTSQYKGQVQSSSGSSASTTMNTASEQLRIFETKKKANQKMWSILLEVIILRIHKEEGIYSPLFHLHCFYKFSEKYQEENEAFSFRQWLLSTNNYNNSKTTIYNDFDKILGEKLSESLPEGTKPGYFHYFNLSIINYFGEDIKHRIIATYACENNFLTQKYSKMSEAQICISDFCTSFNLNVNAFINFEKLSRQFATKISAKPSSSDTQGLSAATGSALKISTSSTDYEMEQFYACKKAIDKMNEKKEYRASLDFKIREFCKKNNRTIIDLRELTEKSKDGHTNSESLKLGVQLMEELIAIEYEIERYDNAMKAVKTLEYITKYESMVVEILKTRSSGMTYRQVTAIITLYGHGLNKPYIFPISFEQYQELIERKEYSFAKIRHEVYYGVAEKGITALQHQSTTSPFRKILSYLNYIITIIELASYGPAAKDSIEISYAFNTESQRKYIPFKLYYYRQKLQELIGKINPTEDFIHYLQTLNSTIIALQPTLNSLISESIHYTWHSKFLTRLYVMANSLLEKSEDELSLHPVSSDKSSPKQRSYSSSSISFHSAIPQGGKPQENRSSSMPPTNTDMDGLYSIHSQPYL